MVFLLLVYICVCVCVCVCVQQKIVIERTRDLIYLKFVATDFFPKIISPSAGENSGDQRSPCYSAVSALLTNPLPNRSNYSPLLSHPLPHISIGKTLYQATPLETNTSSDLLNPLSSPSPPSLLINSLSS